MTKVLDEIIGVARQRGLNKSDLAKIAGMHPASLSRILANGKCQLATVELLAHAVGLKLTCVQDNDLAERLLKGTVF